MNIQLNPKLSNQLVRGSAIDPTIEQAPIPNQLISWLGHKHQKIHVLDAAGFGKV